MQSKRINNINYIVVIYSFLIAFFVNMRCVNWILSYGYFSGGDRGFMSILYPITIFVFFLVWVFGGKRRPIAHNSQYLFFVLFLLAYYLLTILLAGNPRISFPSFLVIVIGGVLLPNLCYVDCRLLLKFVFILPFFGIFRWQQIFFMELSWVDTISLDSSYAFMLPIIANIVYLKFYFSSETIFNKFVVLLFSSINLFYFIQILMFGARGAVFSIIAVIFFMYCVSYDEKKSGIKIIRNRLVVVILAIILTIVLFEPVIKLTNHILELCNIESRALIKILELKTQGDISNGRNDLAVITINGIWDSPLWGHGLDRFDANTGEAYPHNFVLQSLYDGGLILFTVLIVGLLVKSIRAFRNCSYGELTLLITFSFASVLHALFSEDMWDISILWFYYGVLFARHLELKN